MAQAHSDTSVSPEALAAPGGVRVDGQGLHGPTRIWDLPTRLFHWVLAALILFSFATVKAGGTWMDWHMRSGYAVLALVLFRILWGFAGSRYALFSSFVRGPGAVLAYLTGKTKHVAGHNPLGALSVVALLGAVLVQAAAGLFANDDIFNEGPLAKLVSTATSTFLTAIHKRGEYVLYALVGLHLVAVIYYTVFKTEPLVSAMLHGDRAIDAPSAQDDASLRVRALLLLGLCAGLVGYVVTL
jgi:cytochrome b